MLACRWRITIFRSSNRFALHGHFCMVFLIGHDLKEILQIIGNFASEWIYIVYVCVKRADSQLPLCPLNVRCQMLSL